MTDSLDRLLTILEGQDFPHRDELLAAAAQGQAHVLAEPPTSPASIDQLIGAYMRRQESLSDQRSVMARALVEDIAWFRANLLRYGDGGAAHWLVALPRPFLLMLWTHWDDNSVLGCLRVTSDAITRDEHARLWGEPQA